MKEPTSSQATQGGGSNIQDSFDQNKFLIVQIFSAVGVSCLVVLGAVNALNGERMFGISEIFVGMLAATNAVLLQHSRNIDRSSNVILLLMTVVLSSLFVTGGLYGSGLFWFFTFPILGFFLKGTRKGIRWVIALASICLVLYAAGPFLPFATPFSGGLLSILAVSFIAVSVMIYYYELMNERSGRAIWDLIERLSQEKAISEKRADDLLKFQLVVDNAAQHIVITDPDGIVLYANRAAAEVTGYSRAEILGNKPSLWGRQMPREFYTEMWRVIKEEKKTFRGEITNRRKNGELYIASVTISPVVNPAGELKFFVGLEADISKQKELEDNLLHSKEKIEREILERTHELQEEQARLAASISSLPFGFILAGADDKIVLMNPAMSKILELKSMPRSMQDIAASLKGVAKSIEAIDPVGTCRQCMEIGKNVSIDEISYGKKFLKIECAPILRRQSTGDEAEDEKSLGYVFLVADITEAKVMERSRDEFFAVASHELRTPLTAIRGNSDMIMDMYKDKVVDKDVREMLGDINAASVRLIEIVNDFLEASRLEQGKLEIKPSVFDLSELLTKAVRDLQTVAAKKKVSLAYTPTAGLPQVRADKDRIEQIIVNLIGNALKFTSKGGVTVTLERQDEFLKVKVADTGLGISEQNQARLFGKFQQAGEQMLARDVTQSTGLGLYISRLLISGMGGSIGLEESALGKGSIFAFTVPIAE